MSDKTFDEWLAEGRANKWVGPCVCATHDGIPSSSEEDASFEEGNDPCQFVLRLYDDGDHARLVEENHAPSQWRG